MIEMNALLKKNPREFFYCLSIMWGHRERWAGGSPEEGSHQNLTMLVPDQTAEPWETNFSYLQLRLWYPGYGTAQTD